MVLAFLCMLLLFILFHGESVFRLHHRIQVYKTLWRDMQFNTFKIVVSLHSHLPLPPLPLPTFHLPLPPLPLPPSTSHCPLCLPPSTSHCPLCLPQPCLLTHVLQSPISCSFCSNLENNYFSHSPCSHTSLSMM